MKKNKYEMEWKSEENMYTVRCWYAGAEVNEAYSRLKNNSLVVNSDQQNQNERFCDSVGRCVVF
jgi:hypothetical protein